jgi:hypothetical protein
MNKLVYTKEILAFILLIVALYIFIVNKDRYTGVYLVTLAETTESFVKAGRSI